jgi:hypothetical protein
VTEFDKVIRPGGVGKVTASIDTSHFKGPVSKAVTVTTNDPAQPRTTLTITVDIKVPIDIQPSETAMFQGRVGALKPVELTLTSTDGSPFDIVSAAPPDTNVTVKVKRDPSEPAGAAKSGTVASGAKKYVMTVTPSDELKIGPTNGVITVKTTHPKAPDLEVRYFANVTGNILVQPERLMVNVPAETPKEGVVQHVTLRRAPEAPGKLDVKKASSSDARVTAKVAATTPGEEYDVTVTYQGPPPTSSTVANLIIDTSDTLQPTITIPMYIRSAAAAPGGQPMITPMPQPAGGH